MLHIHNFWIRSPLDFLFPLLSHSNAYESGLKGRAGIHADANPNGNGYRFGRQAAALKETQSPRLPNQFFVLSNMGAFTDFLKRCLALICTPKEHTHLYLFSSLPVFPVIHLQNQHDLLVALCNQINHTRGQAGFLSGE